METINQTEAIVRWLARPEAFLHRPAAVEHLETHISHVFLAGPTELTLDALHQRGKLMPQHIDRLAETLARFYESLPPLALPLGAYAQRCLRHVRGNLRQLVAVRRHLPHSVVERVHGFQLQLLRLGPELFEERVAGGRVVDGHGDLRPEHICLGEPVAIFDCIEFSADFRQIDVADELAFLASECDFLGAEWVGPQLLGAYERHTGDRPPDVLWAFYKSYRACVRAKIAALRTDQLQGDAQRAALREAERHLAFADSYAAPWLRPLVLAVGGLSGTGKTTLATALAEAFGAELLRTDVIRRELFGAGPQPAQADADIYSPQSRKRVYDELFRRANSLHKEGISIVLDGTFAARSQLEAARQLVAGTDHPLLAIECVCRPETARERIARRLAAGRDASDATPELRDLQSQRWQPWPATVPQVRVDTEQPLDQQVEAVVSALRDRR